MTQVSPWIVSSLRWGRWPALLLLCTASLAQVTGTATLVGTVTDATGAAVPEAMVTVVNTETAFRSETVTEADGSYTVPYLSPLLSKLPASGRLRRRIQRT